MLDYNAVKVVIITESLVLENVLRTIEEAGAKGYTVIAAGGKGVHGERSSKRPGVSDAFSNVKIEVITASTDVARRIADTVAEKYFGNYAGITYMQGVEVLRVPKF